MANATGAGSNVRSMRRQRREPTLDDLRNALLGPEHGRLENLEQRLGQPVTGESVGEVLAEAAVDSRERGPALRWALEPVVVDAFRSMIERNPEVVAEALHPIVAPVVRKAVTAALREMIERFEVVLERSFSPQSIRWRIEAARTGRPFAEVMLLHTLLYRVEQVLLIHRETGLVLGHLVAKDVPSQDPDQVSSMLSAIERFVRETFDSASAGTGERAAADLERFDVGEVMGLVQHAPSSLLVAIVRGTPSPQLYETLRTTHERVRLEFGDALRNFRGDPSPFEPAQKVLEPCLACVARDRKRPRWVKMAPAILPALILGTIATVTLVRLHASRADARRLESHAAALRAQPGLVLTEVGRSNGRYRFAGLRDPNAVDPARVLARRGLPAGSASLAFAPYLSLDPRLLVQRARGVLRPPVGVTLSSAGSELRAEGIARHEWIERARTLAPTVPGLVTFDAHGLRETEAIETARARAEQLRRTTIHFLPGASVLRPDARAALDEATEAGAEIARLSPRSGLEPRIVVVGSVAPAGVEPGDRGLSNARARYVADALRARGVPAASVREYAADSTVDEVSPACATPQAGAVCEREWARVRRVEFRVELRRRE